MSEAAEVADQLSVQAISGAGRRSVIGLIVRNPLALCGLIVLALIVIVAVLAGVLAPHDPGPTNLALRNAPPGTPGHLLGGDGAGRDILSRLLVGARLTLAGAAIAVAVATLLGVPLGLVAGYVGGWIDSVISWISDVLLSVPGMVVLLAVIASFGSSVLTTMAAFGVVLMPHMFRLVRNLTVGVRNNLYVDAARVSGISDVRIVGRHILYVVRAPAIVQGSYLAGIAIIVQSGLAFLGFGGADDITWGAMLGDAFSVIYQARTAMYWPGGAIAITVASLLLLGNGLRDAVERAAPNRTRRPARMSLAPRPRSSTPGRAEHTDLVLEVSDLRVGYAGEDGDTRLVVDSIDLGIAAGEVLGLVGESGSGKSQTAFAILGLLPRGGMVDGTVRISGHEMASMRAAARRRLLGSEVGYIPQEPMSNLDSAFKIGAQLVEPLRARGVRGRAARDRILELLDEVGLPDPERTFHSYPHQISGGMAQRVLIAGAVAGDPKLLVADEPTTALDVTTQAEVLSLLRTLQEHRDLAVLMVTHDFGVVADICDTVAVMNQGRIVETSGARALFARPKHPYTQSLLAATLDDTPARPEWRPPAVPDAEGEQP